MHYDLIIRNGVCIFPWGAARADIGVSGGRIASLEVSLRDEASEVINAEGLHVLPGMIDAQVHLRDPGKPEVETIGTGTRAAALGGITLVFDMPNTTPPVTDGDMVRWKQEYASRESWTDFAFYVGATKDNIEHLAEYERRDGVCGIKVFAGSSTGSLLVEDDEHLERIMRSGRRRVTFHSEDEYRLRERRAQFAEGMPYETHRFWRDEECAIRCTRRLVSLSRKTRRRIHILHVSTAEEMQLLPEFRDLVTVEVLANHLTLVAPECYERLGGRAVMNPPIRDQRHNEALWQALRNGLVDVVASDHAPHPRANKEQPWPLCHSGLTGVQTLLPIMLDHVNAGRLSLGRLVDLMAAGPARVYGLAQKGRIALGFDADFTLVDMKKSSLITNDWIATPAGWTPYDGMMVRGWPIMTIIRGVTVMRDDTVIGEPAGRLARFVS